MGLDMYLTKKNYVQNHDYMEKDERHEVIIKKGGKIVKSIKPERIDSVSEEIAYWRKANAIHRWFVDNVQDGNDDCKEYYVDQEQLKELVSLCKEVLSDKNKAAELLPCQEGFFFGSYDYDEWYFNNLEKTVEMLEPELETEAYDFYYCSSW
jgi:hypothetical protein